MSAQLKLTLQPHEIIRPVGFTGELQTGLDTDEGVNSPYIARSI